jgi:hypothetical protein
MSKQPGVTLLINLAPPDLPTAEHTLPHQLRQWGGQVDEIVLVLDTHQSPGKYGEGWEGKLPGMRRLLEECCAQYPHARTVDVDYSPGVAERLGAMFFDGTPVPAKDLLGGPFHSFFFGLDAVRHNYVLHSDADMMYGGGSQTWISEAMQFLKDRPDVLFCCPLPGPPTADGTLRQQTLEPEPYTSLAFRTHAVSTRIYFTDMRRFHSRMLDIKMTRPSLASWLRAVVDGNPPVSNFEMIYSRALAKRGLWRIDFLGDSPGMWSIHPPYRSPLFYARLPELIEGIESGQVPEAQRGHYDMHDSMVDWTSARRIATSTWRRALKHQRLFVRNVTSRLSRSSNKRRQEASGSSRDAVSTPS